QPVDRFGNVPNTVSTFQAIPATAGAPLVSVTPLAAASGALGIRVTPGLGTDPPKAYAITVDCAGKQRAVRCGADGRAVITGLPFNAEVTIAVGAADGEAGAVATTMARTLSPPPDVQAGKGDVAGVVVGPGGQPIAGANVTLDCPGGTPQQTSTAPNGTFDLKSPGAGPSAATLFASAPGHLTTAVAVCTGSKARVQVSLAPEADRAWRLWTAPPLTQTFQDETRPGGASRKIRLVAGRNERECYQVVVRPDRPIDNARIVFEDLHDPVGRRSIAAEGFEARFVSYVPVDENSRATPPEELLRVAPDGFPDELSDDAARDLPADTTQPIFLTFAVPADTPAGVYEGSVYFATDAGLDAVPVALEVLAVDFPDDPRLWVVNWFGTGSFATRYGLEDSTEEWWGMLREYARMFRRYHQNVVTVAPGLCDIWIEADGSRTYDWARFDRWCQTFLDEGVRRINVTHFGGRGPGGWEAPEFVLHDRPAKVRATGAPTTVAVTEFAPALEEHLREKDWLDIANVHVADEPIPLNVESWKVQADLIHKAAPGLKRMDAIHVPDLRGFCELWVPQLDYFDQWHAQYNRWQRDGECELWFYVAWVPQGKY
ncbi:MAG TPA: carboxypeptidase regulatory-like domain-containing protein, partial [Armatimonadota bacterium]|nr:carboxypeptidase regulatory-like domain-containing protein [Armatimonadota bacterium]